MNAGVVTYSDSDNTYVGSSAGADTAGASNVAVGKDALKGVSFTDATCDYNDDPTIAHDTNTSILAGMGVSGTGIPYGAYVDTKTSNIAFELNTSTTGGAVTNGTLTFYSRSTGTVAIGMDALTALTTGANNTAIGYQAGKTATTGASNVYVGYAVADNAHLDSTANVAIGLNAFGGSHTGSASGENVAIGNGAMGAGIINGVTGAVAVGGSALTAITTGAGNVAVGYQAGAALSTSEETVSIGYQALYRASTEADANTAIGYQSMDGNWTSAVVNGCVALGHKTMRGTLTADATGTVAIGAAALNALTTGAGNTAIGYRAGAALTIGQYNTVLGYDALLTSVDGDGNTAIGYKALNLYEGAEDEGNNTAVGFKAGTHVSTGEANTFVGFSAGLGLTGGDVLTGDHNTAVGKNAGLLLQSGAAANVCLGSAAGDGITTGTHNISIGYASDCAAAVDDQIAIGYSTVTTGQYGIAIGTDITSAGDVVTIGRASNVVSTNFQSGDGSWAQSSDERKKRNIKDDSLGLSFINDLKTKTFQWKPADEHPEEWKAWNEDEDGNRVYHKMDTDTVMHGLVAQEVKESMDKVGCDTFRGWKVDDNGQQELSKASFVIPLIKAVQELSAEVESLKEQLNNK
jgi:hypothetical protein